MSNDLIMGIKSLFDNAWSFFTSTTVPGTNMTMATLCIGLAVIPIGFRVLSVIIGFNVGEPNDTAGYGTRSSKKTKISDERKNDVR